MLFLSRFVYYFFKIYLYLYYCCYFITRHNLELLDENIGLIPGIIKENKKSSVEFEKRQLLKAKSQEAELPSRKGTIATTKLK